MALETSRVPVKAARLDAFRTVYEAQEARVRKTLYWLVGPDATSDLVQEVFIRVWKNFDRFRGDAKVSTWIYRITINAAHDHFRSRPKLEVLGDHDAASGANPEKDLAMHQVIQHGILALSEKLRAALVLFYKAELSLDEVAASLDLPVGTVKSRLHEAREQFKATLERQGVRYE